jgi:hypothetical protein
LLLIDLALNLTRKSAGFRRSLPPFPAGLIRSPGKPEFCLSVNLSFLLNPISAPSPFGFAPSPTTAFRLSAILWFLAKQNSSFLSLWLNGIPECLNSVYLVYLITGYRAFLF